MNVSKLVPRSRTTLIASVVAIACLVAVLAWIIPRGPRPAVPAADVRGGTRSVVPPASPSGSGKAVAPARATVKSRPPARLFAGAASAAGILVRVCEGGNCTTLPQGNPPPVEAAGGAPLAFSLATKPAQAWVEIRASSGDDPARVKLAAGTLMTYAPAMGPGRYLLTLAARFENAEARWVFALQVTK